MGLWARASWRFLLFALQPLLHVESIWGWSELIITWLITLGIIASISIGSILESNRWLLTTIAPILFALLLLCAGIRLQYRLLRKFYIRIPAIHQVLISQQFKRMAFIIELTVSNRQNSPSGVSDWILGVQHIDDGHEEWLRPVSLDSGISIRSLQGKENLMGAHHLQPYEPLNGYLCFEHIGKIELENSTLLVYDDTGAPHSIPVKAETMSEMAKKSTSRMEKYKVE